MLRNYTVRIRVIPKALPTGDRVFIVGNQDILGQWKPGAVAMEQREDGSWVREFTLKKNSNLEYKITRGSWQSEAADADGKALTNFAIKVESDSSHTHEIDNWLDADSENASDDTEKAPKAKEKPEDRITGEVRYHRQIKAKGLQPRDIIVWLPPDYKKDARKRYPVLYMHDGQNICDPATAYTGVDWEADETATRLIEEGKMQKIIIVGIYNTPERLEEYSLSPTGKRYREFITNELKPLIDKSYRTKGGREHTATIGSSMGGLVSFLLVWYHSEVFSMAGCLSPSFIFRKNQAIKLIKMSKAPRLPIRINMDCGGIGGERMLHKGCKRIRRILRNKKIPEGEIFRFSFYKKANHSETAWAARLWQHFLFMFGENLTAK